MAAPPLTWKGGEGYDIHLLRGGPESKPLIDALDVAANQRSFVTFIPNLAGGSNQHGVEVDASTGIIKALVHPDPQFPRVHNFLLTAMFAGPGGVTHQTEIRIHVHDSLNDIWLTPPTATIHQGSDECRFTVLARFSDDIVGDITDWPQLTYQSADPGAVHVDGRGVLKAQGTSGSVAITVKLTLAALSISKTSAPARVLARPGWVEAAKNARVTFVAGRVFPTQDNVAAVVEHAANILFVAEGFRQEQRGDFNNYVRSITEELRTKRYLLPFQVLKNSINYWSVFIPSEQAGVTLLGDYGLQGVGAKLTGGPLPLPRKPVPSATMWSPPEMIHEVGLPVPGELDTPWLPDHVRRWQKLFGPHVTEDRTRNAYGAWVTFFGARSLLNERDTAFGMTVGDRPRAVKGEIRSSETFLESAPGARRTSDASIATFIENLEFLGYPIGARWTFAADDESLVCFICLGEPRAGTYNPRRYFTACTGLRRRASLRPAAGLGLDIQTSAPERHSRTLLAARVAHECGHALGLGDEYGDGRGTVAPRVPNNGNLQAKSELTSTRTTPSGTTTVFDKIKDIKWLWPRLVKAGALMAEPFRSGTGLRVLLRKGHGKSFRLGDLVWFRQWPVRSVARFDPFLRAPRANGFVFKVKAKTDDSVDVDLETPSGDVVDLDARGSGPGARSWTEVIHDQFSASTKHALIVPRTADGIELKLVAEPILKHMESTSLANAGPLSAEPGFDPALCVADVRGGGLSSRTPTNLPPLSNEKKLIKQDIIGLYEGGGYHDCGSFRPAGRCKMRASEKTIPFCMFVATSSWIAWIRPNTRRWMISMSCNTRKRNGDRRYARVDRAQRLQPTFTLRASHG